MERIFEMFSTFIVGSSFTLLQVITSDQSITAPSFAALIFVLSGLPGVFHWYW